MILLQNAALRPTATSGHKLTFEEANPSMLLPLVTINVIRCYPDAARKYRMAWQGLAFTSRISSAPATIDRLLHDFQKVLEHMVTQPERPISAIRVSLNEKRPQPVRQ